MIKLIRGKVARILNSREVALNVGANEGVREGMQFDILSPELHDIKDPDTQEVIGSVNRPKIRVLVSVVEDRFCVAHTFRHKRVNIGGKGLLDLGWDRRLFDPPKWVTRYETLKTPEATWEDLSEEDSFVKTGDPVIEVPDDTKTEIAEASVAHGQTPTPESEGMTEG